MFVFTVVGFSECISLYLNEREKCYGRPLILMRWNTNVSYIRCSIWKFFTGNA